VSARTKALLGVLVAETERCGWGHEPGLYRIHQLDGVPHLVDMGLHVWQEASAQDVLGTLAAMMAAGSFRARPGDPAGELVGMAFRNEAVWVEDDPADAHAMHTTGKLAGEGRLWQHPRRVDISVMIGVDRHGVTYQVIHKRGGSDEAAAIIPGRQDMQAAGAIPEALDAMVATLCGVTMPKRPSPYVTTTEGLN
jgi:hypothetical protein